MSNEETLNLIWNNALEIIKTKISKPSFDTWIATAQLVSIHEGTAVIKTSTEFNREWLDQRYTTLIAETLKDVSNGVRFISDEQNPYQFVRQPIKLTGKDAKRVIDELNGIFKESPEEAEARKEFLDDSKKRYEKHKNYNRKAEEILSYIEGMKEDERTRTLKLIYDTYFVKEPIKLDKLKDKPEIPTVTAEDFVKEKIDKIKQINNESLKRMEEIKNGTGVSDE